MLGCDVSVRILVTGGAGFIGSNFCRMFDKKYDITVLDILNYAGNKKNLEGVKHKFVRGDVRDKKLVNRLVRRMDAVVHFAAESHVCRSIERPEDFLTTNIHGTNNLLDAATRFKKRILVLSTDEIYGPAIDRTFDESSPFRPSSPYSAAKAAADLLCQAYFTTENTNVVIARPSNNYGPYQHPEKVIPRFIILALQDKPLPLFRPGRQLRQWLHTDDCCLGLDLLLRRGKSGEAYNIGGDDRIQNIKLAELILDILPHSKSKVQMIEGRKGHDWAYSISSEKIKTLGWRPQIDFEAGLLNTVRWYAEHSEWWRPLVKDRFVDFGGKKC